MKCPICKEALRVLGGGPQFDDDYVCVNRHLFRGEDELRKAVERCEKPKGTTTGSLLDC
jgi:hypothetical protein